MTIEEINTRITFYTNASTTNYTAPNRLIAVNSAVDQTHMEILEAQDGDDFDDKNYTSDFPVSTTDLVANQRDYTVPTEAIKEKRLVVTYDGTNWYKATPFDVNQSGSVLKDSDFNVQSPYYDLHDNSVDLWPKPTAAVTGGLKIWVSRAMELYTAAQVSTGTKSPGFDRQWHELIPLKASYDWLFFKVKDYAQADRIQLKIDTLTAKMKKAYSDKQRDDNMVMTPMGIDEYDTGNGTISG